MILFKIPDGAIDRETRAAYQTRPFDLDFGPEPPPPVTFPRPDPWQGSASKLSDPWRGTSMRLSGVGN